MNGIDTNKLGSRHSEFSPHEVVVAWQLATKPEVEWRRIEWSDERYSHRLREIDKDFDQLYRTPGSDYRKNREIFARCLFKQWPDYTSGKLAMELAGWEEGAGRLDDNDPDGGDYNFLDVARLWVGCQELRRARDILVLQEPKSHIVKDMIPKQSVGVLYGPPNVGKSFLALDLAHCVRRGKNWFGRRTQLSDVLYVFGEGHSGLKSRLRALYRGDGDPTDFAVQKSMPNLYDDENALEKLTASVRNCASFSGVPVGLVIIDTLSKAIAGANEDSSSDMNRVLTKLRRLATELDLAVVLVHHSGKAASRGMRGSSAILGDVDFCLEVVEGKNGVHRIRAEKMRDGPKGDIGSFQLKPIEVDADEAGGMESCIVVPEKLEGILEPTAPDVTQGCELIVRLLTANGVSRQGECYEARLSDLLHIWPELNAMKVKYGKAFGRVFRDRFLLGDYQRQVQAGVLEYVAPDKRGGASLLRFRPSTVACLLA